MSDARTTGSRILTHLIHIQREVMGLVIRDIQVVKPMGSIESIARVRHFQVDAMIPNARYPIIIQPIPLGVDRREDKVTSLHASDLIIPETVQKKQCYWVNSEKPVPVLDITCAYVPQVMLKHTFSACPFPLLTF